VETKISINHSQVVLKGVNSMTITVHTRPSEMTLDTIHNKALGIVNFSPLILSHAFTAESRQYTFPLSYSQGDRLPVYCQLAVN